jgi:hypothetical protein
MTEQFRVEFIGDNKLSAVLARVSRELESVYTRAGTAANSITALNGAMSGSRATTLSQDVRAMSTSLKSIQNVSISKIIGQFATFERRTAGVMRNLAAIEASLQNISQMPNVTANIQVPQPPRQGGGGGGGRGGANLTAFQEFERYLHIFNSVTFALGTLQIMAQQYYDTVRAGNELTRAQTLLMSVVQSEGILPGITAMQKYGQAIQVAARNQILFGGTLSESIEGILKLQQISQSAGMSINTLNDAVQLLSLRDPVQGIEGATIAIQELISGDPMSLRRRFELPADAVNRLANMSGNAQAQIQGLTELLATQGITLDALNDQLNTTAATYNRLESAASNAYQRLGQQLARFGEPVAAAAAESLAGVSVGLGPFRELAGVMNLNPLTAGLGTLVGAFGGLQDQMLQNVDIAQQMDAETRALFEGMVQNGTITAEATRARLEREQQAYEYSIGVINRYAAETEAAAARQREAFAGDFADNYRQKILDLIDAQMKANSSTRAKLHLDAAAELAQTNLSQAVLIYARSLNVSQAEAEELIKLKMVELNLTEDNIRALYGLEVAVEEVKTSYQLLAESMAESNKGALEQKQVDEYLLQLFPSILDGTIKFAQAQVILAQAFGLSNEQALALLDTYMNLMTFDPDEIAQRISGNYIPGTLDYFGKGATRIYGQAYREAMRAYNPREAVGVVSAGLEEINKEQEKAGKKRLSTIESNNQRMLDIEAETYVKLLEYDKEIYRKRIKELQEYFASATLMTQRRAYETTANNLDLIEGRNSKLDAETRQRLLARENIEAYGTLQLNEATRKANEIALNGDASFAKEYLSIQENRVADTEDLNWKLHDTLVRLEGDPAAQERAKTVHAESLAALETYYDTRIGLAKAAAEQEKEAEREARKQIIDDAIASVMAFTEIDEGKRKDIVDGLNVAKTTIADLSSVYVSGVDAMRGSLELLAKAMMNVKEQANILTPEQLAMFNGLPSGIGSAGPGSNIDITDSNNTTTVNVGGITVSVQSQADPNQIAQTVLQILQDQQNQRGG